MGKLVVELTDTDWMKQRLPPFLHSLPALQAYLDANGLSVEHFKQTAVYRANVGRVAWMQGL